MTHSDVLYIFKRRRSSQKSQGAEKLLPFPLLSTGQTAYKATTPKFDSTLKAE